MSDVKESPKKIKIEWFAKEGGLNQIYRRGLEYAFISEKNEQCHGFVLCKDFLQDALWAFHRKQVASIFGFKYDPKTQPALYLERTRIALTNTQDNKFLEKIEACVDFLNQIEKELHFVRTNYCVAENPRKQHEKCGVVVIEGSSKWQQSPPMISLYSLLIRVGFTHKTGDDYKTTIRNLLTGVNSPYQTHDKDYLRQSEVGFKRIAKYGWKAFYRDQERNFPAKASMNDIHNCGIVGYSGNNLKNVIPYWYRAKIKV